MTTIYGVDTNKEVTPEMVRDAIITCFCSAHSAQSEMQDTDKEMTKQYCTQIVMKAFNETKGDFTHPTKQSLLTTLPWLADFSKSFRDQAVIQTHMHEIQSLITLLKD